MMQASHIPVLFLTLQQSSLHAWLPSWHSCVKQSNCSWCIRAHWHQWKLLVLGPGCLSFDYTSPYSILCTVVVWPCLFRIGFNGIEIWSFFPHWSILRCRKCTSHCLDLCSTTFCHKVACNCIDTAWFFRLGRLYGKKGRGGSAGPWQRVTHQLSWKWKSFGKLYWRPDWSVWESWYDCSLL